MKHASLLATLLIALFAGTFASGAAAGEVIVERTGGTFTHTYPFSSSTQNVRRFQIVIDKSALQGNVGKITELGFRVSASGTKTYPNATMKLGQTSGGAGNQSTTFANNYTFDGPFTVKTGNIAITSVAGQFWRIPFDTPYDYDGQGNLTVEFLFPTNPNPNPSWSLYRQSATGRYLRNTSTTSTTAITGSSYLPDFSIKFENGEDLTWNGNTSTDWNTSTNWTPNKTPEASDTFTIPSAATTMRDPSMSAASIVGDVVLQAGSVVNLSGTVKVQGDWTNEGGTINYGASTLHFDSSGKTIDNNGQYIPRSMFSGGETTWVGDFTPGSAINVTINSGAGFALADGDANFTNVTLTNNGSIGFTADGGTTNTTINVALPATPGDVVMTAADLNDTVNVTSVSPMDSLEMKGGGDIDFPGQITVNDDFKCAMTGSTSSTYQIALDLTGTCDIDLTQTRYLRLTVSASVGDVTANGSGATYLYGTLNDSNVNHTGTGPYYQYAPMTGGNVLKDTYQYGEFRAGINSPNGTYTARDSGQMRIYGGFNMRNISMYERGRLDVMTSATLTGYLSMQSNSTTGYMTVSGDLNISSYLIVNPTIVKTRYLDVNGSLSVGSFVQIWDSGVEVSGNFTTNSSLLIRDGGSLDILGVGTSSSDSLDVIGTGAPKLLTNGNFTVDDGMTTATDAVVEVDGDLTLRGGIDHQGSGDFTVGGEILLNGSGVAGQQDFDFVGELSFGTLRVINNLSLFGAFKGFSTAGNQANPSILLSAGSSLQVGPDTELEFASGAFVEIAGTFTTNTSNPLQAPEFIGANVANGQLTMVVRSTATLSLNSMRFTRIGSSAQQYAMIVENGATLATLKNVSFTDVRATTAAIDLNTSNLTDAFWTDFYIDGDSPVNIDAKQDLNVNLVITIDTNGGGNLFDGSKEIDNGLWVYWNVTADAQFQSPTSLTKALTGNAYSNFIGVSGGNLPYLYSITSGKPDWLEINNLTGELTGTPEFTDRGTVNIVITVGDNKPTTGAVMKAFEIVVEEPPYFAINVITPPRLAGAQAGAPYVYAMVATLGIPPYSFELLDEPTWLEIDDETGVITGVPPILFEGDVEFKVSVNDQKPIAPAVVNDYSFNVNPSGYTVIEIVNVPDTLEAYPEVEYSQAIGAINGNPPYSYDLVNAPGWLSVDNEGVMNGTPPVGGFGTFNFNIEVSDTQTFAPAIVKSVTLNVVPVPYASPQFQTASLLPSVQSGLYYSTLITAILGTEPYAFSLENNPEWLSIDSGTGLLTGTAPVTFAGVLNFTVRIDDDEAGAPTVERIFALEVTPDPNQPPVFSTSPVLIKGSVGNAYSVTLSVYGIPSDELTWAAVNENDLPPGFELIAGTGELRTKSGLAPTSNQIGSYQFDVIVTDANNNSQTRTFQLEITAVEENDAPGGAVAAQVDHIPGSGGCAINAGSSALMLLLLAGLFGVLVLRREEA